MTYTWVRSAGILPTISGANTVSPTVAAPELSADQYVEYRVTVSDGVSQASDSVRVDLRNIVQTPLFAGAQLLVQATFTTNVRMLIGDFRVGLAGSAPTATAPLSFVGIKYANEDFTATPTPLPEAISKPADFKFSSEPIIFESRPNFGVVQEDLNRFRMFVNSSGDTFQSLVDYAIDKPCSVSFGKLANGAPDAIFIGQRGKGFTILRLGTGSANVGVTTSVYRTNTSGRSFCALLPVATPLGGSTFSDFRYLQELIALDTDTNMISVFTQSGAAGVDTVNYALKQTVPVQMNATGTLKFVKAVEVGGFNSMKSALAMLFTDGRHDGEHRLVIAGINSARELVQETHTWGVGVPVDVMLDNFDEDFQPEVIVLTSTSPYAAVFESMATTYGGFLPLGGPSFLEIGLGASSGLPRRLTTLSVPGMYVAFPEKKQVLIFGTPPTP